MSRARSLRALLRSQIHGGLSVDELALAVGLGVAGGLFPIFGTTTAICAVAAIIFRVNQVVIQAVNYLMYPVYFFALAGLVVLGAWAFGEPIDGGLVDRLRALSGASPRAVLAALGAALLHAVIAWAALAPVVVFGVRRAARLVLHRFM